MKRLGLFLVPTVLPFIFAGCCNLRPRTEPQLPSQVSGWNERTEKWLKIEGEFVLQKGSAVQNDDIKMALVEIIPGRICAEPGTFPSNARAKIEFRRTKDLQLLCVEEFSDKSSGSLPLACREEMASYGFAGFEIPGINVKDGWVLIRLLG